MKTAGLKQKTLKVGFIGMGHRGKKHLKILNGIKDIEPVWILDPYFKEDLTGNVRLLSSFDECKDHPVDFIVMSVPHHEYLPLIENCGKNRIKYILKEKPVACSLKETYELKVIEDLYNMKIAIACQRRYSNAIQKIKTFIEKYGPPLDFTYKYYLGLKYDQLDLLDWREDKSLAGGGAVIDMGYHAIDIISYLLGKPSEVTSYLRKPVDKAAVESGALINLYFKNSCGTIYLERFLSPKSEELCFHWRDFSLQLVNNVLYKNSNYGKEEILTESNERMLSNQMNDFINLVNGNDHQVCTVSDSINTIEMIECCYLNAKWKIDSHTGGNLYVQG